MKVFDSGMPDEAYWNSLFNIPLIVSWLHLKDVSYPIVEIGCGYGTFTIPIAKEASGEVHAFDIEPLMIGTAQRNARWEEIRNVRFSLRNVIDQGTGLEPDSVGMVLLFNILHFDARRVMLEEACRILKPGGVISIIHWRKDIETPRGPSIESRPDVQMILDSISGLDLYFTGNRRILEPYHWGMQLLKGTEQTGKSNRHSYSNQ